MADILSQEEIDALDEPIELFDDIYWDNFEMYDIDGLDLDIFNWSELKAKGIEEYFHKVAKELKESTSYGMFEKDVSMNTFFEDPNGENILDEIYERNKKSNYGNFKIPQTNIELVNFSKCPYCEKVYTMKELNEYYRQPYIPQGYNKMTILREDTSVMCACKNRFNPSLLIIDGTPKDEKRFLCRNQTIEAIEQYFQTEFSKSVLTKNKSGIKKLKESKFVVQANLDMNGLALRPTLLTNYLQYSTAQHAMKILEDDFSENDLVFGGIFKFKKAI